MLIVTGATGELGRRVVDHLLAHVPANGIGVSVRDPSKATALVKKGVRVRHGDYGDADSLRSAFEGAERVLLVSSNAAASGGDPRAQHRTAIDVAREVGVSRILYTSQISSAADSQFFPGRDHAATEAMLAASGLPWTALRHGFYASSGRAMNQRGFDDGVMAAPADGKVSWTTHDDLAAADAALLAGVEEIDGPTPPLTAGDALDLADLAALAGDVLDRPVTREVLDDDEMRVRLRGRGMPDGAVAFLMGYFLAAWAGEFAPVDPTLERLLGRKARSMRSYLEEVLAS